MKKKYVFLGDINSINIEVVNKSHRKIKNKIKYILLGNIKELSKYLKKISSTLKINEIYNPLNFESYDKNSLNIFNIENISLNKYENLLNQIKISNYLANSSKCDLVTLPVDKSIFKKEINFTGMTEYLSKLNNKKTIMLMLGENLSTIPLTTHINLNEINNLIHKKILTKKLKVICKLIKNSIYKLKFKRIIFLCYNPHCSENNTLGNEDKILSETISKFKNINGPFAADSSFNNIKKDTLYISMYHDQALIPFKILNKRGINMTLGLSYRRLSPAHGTAKDIRFKNKANVSSYIACMSY